MKSAVKKIGYLVFCGVAGLGMVIILFYLSNFSNHRNNQFTRLFPPHLISYGSQMDLRFNSFYFAGFTKTHMFLGNTTAPGYLLTADYSLSDTHQIILHIPSNIPMVVPAIRLYIDSPHIFMMEGRTPKILYGSFRDLSLHEYPDNQLYFNAASIISGRSLFVRAFDRETQKNILIKSVTNPNGVVRLPETLVKKGDGIFSLDGNISRDAYTHHFTYVYYYRNEFVCLDSNGHTLLKGRTIDSVSTPQIKIADISSEAVSTFSAPPLIVNRTSCADSNFLFVNSRLKAKNQDDEDFNETSVIDIYSLKNAEYLYSLYVPDHHHVKIKSFQVFNYQLVALYDHTIITYNLNF
jgi:hypothetical protein